MKKIISAAMAVTLCMGAFTSCGNEKKDKKSGEALSTKGKSEYVSIYPIDGKLAPFVESMDVGIKYSINKAKDYEKENSGAEYSPHVISFSENKFVMPIRMPRNHWTYYDGTFSVENGTVKFSYENWINGDTKINIEDKAEYDPEIAKGTSEKLDGLSTEEKKEMMKKEQEKMGSGAKAEIMQQMNKTEAYANVVAPAMNQSDKWADPTLLPYIRYNKGININIEYPNTLKAVDDFLCTDTYGIKLEGTYKRGKDFKLKHNLIDTIKEDEQSVYHENDDPEEWLERMTEIYERKYGCNDFNSTIEFSDGEWEWFNSDDERLNNGKYEESKDYPGLIKMYIDEDSEKCPEYAKYTFPLWFYIGGDGEIYYPAFVKVG